MRLKRISKLLSSLSFSFVKTKRKLRISKRSIVFLFVFSSEERCEPSNPIYRNRNSQRNCPDLNTWDAFKNYEIRDGLATFGDLKPKVNLPKLPKLPTSDEVSKKIYDKVTGARKRAMYLDDDDDN